ncbi:MAG: TonB-dependent receptor [Longimicrobiales bacterium]
MRRFVPFLVAAAVGVSSEVAAQEASLQGRVWSDDGSPVVGALISVNPVQDTSQVRQTETDDLGFFSVARLADGSYRVQISRIGFALHEETVDVLTGPEPARLEVTLESQALEVEGFAIEGERSRARARFEETAGVTVQDLDREAVKMIPGLAEADPIRAIEVLPGVTTVSDFSAAFNVRGGSADQNLILLDNVPIFNPFHLGGLFSVFNADMVRRAELQSGGFPAEYGGRVSSVLTVETDVGDGETSVEAGISLLSSRVAVDGSLPEGFESAIGLRNSRWRVSGRRSYFDVLFKPFLSFPYHLTDLQSVFEGWTKGGNRFQITAYSGRDVLDLTDVDPDDIPLQIKWSWGNDAIGGTWTHPMAGGGALDFRASFSRFASDFGFPEFDDTNFATKVTQGSFGADLEIRPTPRTKWKSGLVANRMSYDNILETGGTVFAGGEGSGWELGGYSQFDWQPTSSWLVEAGVRVDRWVPTPGPREVTIAPRFAVKRFLPGGNAAVRVAGGRYSQFLHSIRDEELPIGLDVWVLAGDRTPRVLSDQIQVGVESFFGSNDEWFGSVEGYYRTYDGVVTQNFAENPNDELDDFLTGDGESYGVDFFLRKDQGETTGWISVSFLKTDRTFPDTRFGVEPVPIVNFPPVFDRRVDVDLVLSRPMPWGTEGGIRWNLGTGLPYTLPLGGFTFYRRRVIEDVGLEPDDDFGDGVALGPRNGARYPVRHRLDMSFRKPMTKGWGTLTPYLNVINVYNQKNVLFYFFEYDRSPPTRSGISMIPLLPTIGVEITF